MDESAEAPDNGRISVLLVEDDAAVLAVTSAWLHSLGYEVLVCSDGRAADALGSRRRAPIDVLLTDVMLPGMRGPAVATAIRRRHPEAAVIYTSGYSPELVGEMFAFDSCSAPLLHKPYTRDQLASTLRLALSRKPPREDDGPGSELPDPSHLASERATARPR